MRHESYKSNRATTQEKVKRAREIALAIFVQFPGVLLVATTEWAQGRVREWREKKRKQKKHS